MFGIVKPAIWPSTPETPATEQPAEALPELKATLPADGATEAQVVTFEEPTVAPEISFDDEAAKVE